MKYLLRHIKALVKAAIIICLASQTADAGAQEVNIPERWKKAITDIPGIYQEDTVSIIVMGDVMMHQNQINTAYQGDRYDFSSYFSLIADKIRKADIAVANMEFTLGGEPYSGYPCFSAPDEFAIYLADCGFDIFLTANNHIFDKGTEGAERTLRKYRELKETHGICFTGLASDEREAQENTPLVLRSKGIRIAFVNATYGTNLGLGTKWPQTVRLSSEDMMEKALYKAEEAGSDIVMVFPHWGEEYTLTHSQRQEERAMWLAEKGADMIIGAHPHVIQDFQILNVRRNGMNESVPVAYSLGNAVSNMSAENTQLELMATIRIVRKANGDMETLPIEFTYLWCSRPGGYCDSYTVIPVEEYMDRKNEWKNSHDHDKMMKTYRHVRETTGIKDKHTIVNE